MKREIRVYSNLTNGAVKNFLRKIFKIRESAPLPEVGLIVNPRCVVRNCQGLEQGKITDVRIITESSTQEVWLGMETSMEVLRARFTQQEGWEEVFGFSPTK